MAKNAIILCSGGVDSVTTAYYAKKRLGYKHIIILFFNYGQRTLEQERRASKKYVQELKAKFIEIKLEWLGEISNSLINKSEKAKKITRKELRDTKAESYKYYVPCRNTVFLVYALALAESVYIKNKEKYDIFVGFKQEGRESYPDTTKKFVEEMNKLSKISCSTKFNIFAPLINKDKEDIILLGKKLGVNFKDTYSCYIGTGKKQMEHCGVCLSCRLRQEGFYWADVIDPTSYKEKMKDFRLAK
ncbi:MAG: 7-cyano-7-deazaguanine synthase QueC [Nanoarchaeota archaeon]|nr:7-cyano-7-deazaguanine synthase QueC [Nanoarchaeota archaeon]